MSSSKTSVVDHRAAHRDIVLGMPVAYGFGNGPAAENNAAELAGFLSYGHAYGLLQHDLVREYLLELYALSAHQYTRGSWTAPETRRIDPEQWAAPYCVPAQLSVPLALRWLLVWEDPADEVLWLCRAAPRDWFTDGRVVAAERVPSRWGPVAFRIESRLGRDRVEVTLDLPPTGPDPPGRPAAAARRSLDPLGRDHRPRLRDRRPRERDGDRASTGRADTAPRQRLTGTRAPNHRGRWRSRSCWWSPTQATWPSGRSSTAGTSSSSLPSTT